MLRVEKVSKTFEGLHALQDVSFEAQEGEIVGLVGPNGAGKSTLINVITGINKPSKGKVLFRGREITGWSPNRICREGITRTFQSVQSFPSMTALENVMVGSMFGKDGQHSKAHAEEKALEALDMIDFPTERRDKNVTQLSTIDTKRVQLARALATEPELLMLDEILTGLNPRESSDAVKLIGKLRSSGITILMVEHIMRIIMNVSDRIVVLNYGEKIAEGTPREVAGDESVIESYLGEKFHLQEGGHA